MARVRKATRGEVLRAAQKDASYLEALEGKVGSSYRFPDPLPFRVHPCLDYPLMDYSRLDYL